jgi:dihydroflavonol-4-reductase
VGLGKAFVTGSTGLLGNNLVRELVGRGVEVRALARSAEKARKQFAGLDVEVVEGDVRRVTGFATSLRGVDVVFHTAAYFRDSYKGGSHARELNRINVDGTADLLSHSYSAGIRKFVHTSSVAVLSGAPGAAIDETMRRDPQSADDYYRSKILADREVEKFVASHPDFDAVCVLPGWMHGPGDMGPTSAGQMVLDFVKGQLPGVIPGSFSVVDARDVAAIQIAAAERGRRGELYLAAGRHMTMADLFRALEQVSGVKAPGRKIPLAALYAIAGAGELWHRVTGKPVLLSMATVRLIGQEADRSHYDHGKTVRELGGKFRPVEETLADEIAWYGANGYLPVGRLRGKVSGRAEAPSTT